MPYYTIRHITRYRYSAPVRENVTETRMQPRTEGNQRCIEFKLAVVPHAPILAYHDHLGNTVHYFDLPAPHVQLRITAEATVETLPAPVWSDTLTKQAWQAIDHLAGQLEFWDFLQPSRFTQPTSLLKQLGADFDVSRRVDPLTMLRMITENVYETFDYAPQSTRVDSLIDEAISARRGVCQDFTHIMIALVRSLGIPCRYVSGYLFHRLEDHDRSAEDATHAWLEAFLPELGWLGFDPTNNLIVADRHIRVAVGRDYADVSPSRGVFKGDAQEQLSVGVRVALTDAPPEPDEEILPDTPWSPPSLAEDEKQWQKQQQQ